MSNEASVVFVDISSSVQISPICRALENGVEREDVGEKLHYIVEAFHNTMECFHKSIHILCFVMPKEKFQRTIQNSKNHVRQAVDYVNTVSENVVGTFYDDVEKCSDDLKIFQDDVKRFKTDIQQFYDYASTFKVPKERVKREIIYPQDGHPRYVVEFLKHYRLLLKEAAEKGEKLPEEDSSLLSIPSSKLPHLPLPARFLENLKWEFKKQRRLGGVMSNEPFHPPVDSSHEEADNEEEGLIAPSPRTFHRRPRVRHPKYIVDSLKAYHLFLKKAKEGGRSVPEEDLRQFSVPDNKLQYLPLTVGFRNHLKRQFKHQKKLDEIQMNLYNFPYKILLCDSSDNDSSGTGNRADDEDTVLDVSSGDDVLISHPLSDDE